MLPWSLKVVFGLVFDNIPIMRRHSKPYLLLASILGIIGFVFCSFDGGVPSWRSFIAFGFLIQLGGASSDVLVDGIVVKSGRTSEEGNSADLQVLSWVCLGLGDILSNLIGGELATPYEQEGAAKMKLVEAGKLPISEVYKIPTTPLRWYFRMMLIFPALIFLLTIFYKEPLSKTKIAFKPIAMNLWKVIKTLLFTPAVLKPMLWVYFSNMSRIRMGAAWSLYNTQVLKLTARDMSYISTVSSAFFIIGTLLYGRFFKGVPYRKIFFWSQIGVIIMNFTSYMLIQRWNVAIGIPDYAFLLLTSCVDSVISRLNSMPFLVLAAQVCPPDMEATFFALLMSLSNLTAGQLPALWSKPVLDAYKVRKGNFVHFDKVNLINMALSVLPLFLVWMLPTYSAILTDEQKVELGIPVEEKTPEEKYRRKSESTASTKTLEMSDKEVEKK
ncbi:folate-biopterin transporter [Paraphysoderma sedebokerense]|nr:folate-biopterin transporter [Paraphysoderma sedebokerense]